MLGKEIWGNSIENWGISFIVIVCFLVVMKLVSLFNKKVIKAITKKTANRLDDIVYDAVESPVLFGIALVGMWVAIHRLIVPDNILKGIDRAYKILVVLNATWLIVRFINSLLEVYWINRSDNSQRTQRHTVKTMPIVKRTIVVIIWGIGVVMALSNVGVNISALLGTLGIGGIAFALAAQDTIKNVFGAFTIFADRPFRIGDTVRIDNFEGTIVDVGGRSTKMRNYDKRIITFPNYKIADASIVNISAEPMRRVVTKLGLMYNTTPENMKEALRLLREIPFKVEFVASKDLVANFTDFADSALVITFIYFIEKKGDVGETTSNVNMEILTSFNQAGLSFAFPSQTLYIEGNDSLKGLVN